MKITFLGAAGEVTGSQHLIETEHLRVLLDCGLFQGHRSEARAKNIQFRCDPRKLDGVILSHAHIDHCGNLPGLYRAGYRGTIFCTRATADIAAHTTGAEIIVPARGWTEKPSDHVPVIAHF